QLERLGAREASDTALAAAGLSFTNLGPGRNKIFMRGLSDGASSGRTVATVGVYYDDSRVVFGAPNPDLSLVDADIVEVVRGPQGALYGDGAVGGVFRLVPRAPDLRRAEGFASARIEAAEPGNVGSSIAGVVSAPLVEDRLGARFVAYRDVTAGWL